MGRLTDLQLPRRLPDLIRVERPIGLSCPCGFTIRAETENILHDVPGFGGPAAGFDAEGDLDLRLRLGVRVLFRVLSQTL